jgi:tetratricopeptide (TPR) repeat protein
MTITKIDTVFKLFKNTTICFLMFFNMAVSSQNKPIKSTVKKDSLLSEIKEDKLLKKTRDYISRKEYSEAIIFLSKHYNNFSESLNVNWLYAYVLSMNNEKKKAVHKYKKAISISPLNKNIQFDYARLLYEMGKIDKVEAILSNFIEDDSKNVEFLLMQARISFWK